MNLDSRLIDRIFNRLLGIYGAQFKSKFSVIENGKDVGVSNAKETWAYELRSFRENLEAIAYALENLPTDHAPNAIEFREICRRAPKKEVPALSHTPTAADMERAREMSHKVAAELKPKFDSGIDRHWATHPRSAMQLRMIFDVAKNDARFRPCVAEMVEQGICTDDGKLLKKYSGTNQWSRV